MVPPSSPSPGEATTGSASSPPPPPPFGTGRPRQLRRRPHEGHIAGVCAGVAEYFGVDVVIVRIAAVVLAFSGPGVLAYALAWVFVPAAGSEAPTGPLVGHGRHDRGAQIFGIVLLAVAMSILWGGWWSPARRWIFPLGLIVLGGWLILRRDDSDDTTGVDAGPGSPSAERGAASPAPPWAAGSTETGASSLPVAEPSEPGELAGATVPDGTVHPAADAAADPAGWADPTVGPTAGTDPAAGPEAAGPTAEQSAGQSPWPWGGAPGWPGSHRPWEQGHRPRRAPLTEEERAARRRRRMVFPVVMGALLLWTGVAFIAGVGLQTGLAISLCLVGMGFVLGAFVGGSKALILPALVLASALVATSVLDLPLEGPVGSRTWRPDQVADIDDHYQMSMGEEVVDLTGLDLTGHDEVEVRASLGIGHLLVRVPSDVALEVRAESSAGEVKILGLADNGVGVSTDRRYGIGAYDTTLVLDLEVGLGQVEVVAVPADGGRGRVEATTPAQATTAPDPTTPSTLG